MTLSVCPNGCGPATDSQKFCRVCGARMVAQASPTVAASSAQGVQTLCPNCHSVNPPSKRFCRMCGIALDIKRVEETPAPQSVPQEQPVREAKVPPSVAGPAAVVTSTPVSGPSVAPTPALDATSLAPVAKPPVVARERAAPERSAHEPLAVPMLPRVTAVPRVTQESEKSTGELASPVSSIVPAQRRKLSQRSILAVAVSVVVVGVVVAFFVLRPVKTAQPATTQGPALPAGLVREAPPAAQVQQQVPAASPLAPETQPNVAVATTKEPAPNPQTEVIKRDLQRQQAELEVGKQQLADQQRALEAQKQEEAQQAARDAERARQEELSRQQQLQKQAQLEPPKAKEATATASVPAPYEGPGSGTLIWEGDIAGAELVTIENGVASSGRVTGVLPGVPCLVQSSDPKRVSVATRQVQATSGKELS